jgi:alkylation response protein AidB-like acyl-CoA dehydrogenase
MDLDLNREQKILKRSAQEFLKKECPPSLLRAMKEDQWGCPRKLWNQMAELGWTGVTIPEQYGGSGGNFLDLCILLEAMGEVCCPGPFFPTVVLATSAIMSAGTKAQMKMFLPKIAGGEWLLAFAVTEPGGAYDTSGIRMTAVGAGDDYILQGTKLFAAHAHIADYLVCAARTEATRTAVDGLTLFLVDAKDPRIQCTLLKTLAYDRQCEVIFDRVRVPKGRVLGEVHRARDLLETLWQRTAVAKCAELVGCIQTAFDRFRYRRAGFHIENGRLQPCRLERSDIKPIF